MSDSDNDNAYALQTAFPEKDKRRGTRIYRTENKKTSRERMYIPDTRGDVKIASSWEFNRDEAWRRARKKRVRRYVKQDVGMDPGDYRMI